MVHWDEPSAKPNKPNVTSLFSQTIAYKQGVTKLDCSSCRNESPRKSRRQLQKPQVSNDSFFSQKGVFKTELIALHIS